MKQNKIIMTAILATTGGTIFAHDWEPELATDLEKIIFSYGSRNISNTVPKYMIQNGINSTNMLGLLENNIQYHLEHYGTNNCECGSLLSNTMFAMKFMGEDAGPMILKYADVSYTNEIRRGAVYYYLQAAKLSGLPFASNAVMQTWRSSDEQYRVRSAFIDNAKSASPQDRKKYAAFFQWIGTIPDWKGASWETLDNYILELDPSWRTNALRRTTAEFQLQYERHGEATNAVIGIMLDYEKATGIVDPNTPELLQLRTFEGGEAIYNPNFKLLGWRRTYSNGDIDFYPPELGSLADTNSTPFIIIQTEPFFIIQADDPSDDFCPEPDS